MTSVAPPMCKGCAHLLGDLRRPHCQAFPQGIPQEILLSQADHREPVAGDHGIRFSPRTPADAAYAAALFGKPA